MIDTTSPNYCPPGCEHLLGDIHDLIEPFRRREINEALIHEMVETVAKFIEANPPSSP